MGEVSKIVRELSALASEIGFQADWRDEFDQLNIWSLSLWYSVNVNIRKGEIFPYISVKGPFDAGGNRTPTIELLSIYFGLSLYLMGYCSVCVWDVEHPCIEGELNGQFLSLGQAQKDPTPFMGINGIQVLLLNLFSLEKFIPEVFQCSKLCCDNGGEEFSEENFSDWSKRLTLSTEKWDKEMHFEYNRCLPVWSHTLGEDISILYCPKLILDEITSASDKMIEIDGLSGKLIINKGIRNYVSYTDLEEIQSLFDHIKECESKVFFFLFENAVIGVADSYLIKKKSWTGIKEFNVERQSIRSRHQLESQYLFGGRTYVWAEKIDDERFEFLCEELVKLEADVGWARKVGAGRAPDGGKDIIFERQVADMNLSEERLDFDGEKWIAQCKAYKGNVGKRAVTDIRDTVEGHNAVGYLLIVSTYITPDLINQLCHLKEEGKVQVEWWTRTEIEERLEGNPHLLTKYSDIVWPS